MLDGFGNCHIRCTLLVGSRKFTSSKTMLLATAPTVSTKPRSLLHLNILRFVSSSPYGRTHVWKRRPPKLPNPVVPQFPQRVVLADGSSYTHWTTSPRSVIRLTKDTTNNSIWQPWMETGNAEDLEGETTGRLGRFRRRFEELGGTDMQTEWVDDATAQSAAEVEVAKLTHKWVVIPISTNYCV